MKIRTHVKLAELAFIKNITPVPKGFSKFMFIFGLTMVDQSWLVKTHPHYTQHSLEYIKKKIEYLHSIKKFNAYHSMQLGIVVHYLCDFCCHSHITGGIGNISYHLKYERGIQKYLLDNFDNLKSLFKNNPAKIKINNIHLNLKDSTTLSSSIDNVLSSYVKGNHSYLWDIKKCVEITDMVCYSIFNLNFAHNYKLKIVRRPNLIGRLSLSTYGRSYN